MALKPLRETVRQDISMFLNETAERGCVVVYSQSSSGLGDMDDASSLCVVPTGMTGPNGPYVPVGVLMNDVVNLDLSRYHLNQHQDEVQKNSKVTILKVGAVRTNMIQGHPLPGSGAYFTTTGVLTMVVPAVGSVAQVGRFRSARDADGYAMVEINVP